MPSFRFGLRARLALGFAVILLLSTGTVALFTGYAAQREVARVQHEQDRVRSNRIHLALADYYQSTGGWQDVDQFVFRISFQSERVIVVADSGGRILADSRRWLERRLSHDARRPLPPEYFTPIHADGAPVGWVAIAALRRGHVIPAPPSLDSDPPDEAEPSLARFAEAVRRSLVIVGLAAGAAGVLLVLLFSRRMLRSIGNLTAAARRLGSGDLSSRVAVRGRDEVAELGHAFNSMADALQESERQRRNMVSDVAHELRTPLANIQGHVEAMQDGLLAPDSENLDTVHRQTLYLNRLVNDLRLLAETEARELRLELESQSVVDILSRVAASFRPRAEAQSVRLQVNLPRELPPLNLDRLRIEQVAANLIDNAIRHTPPGGTVVVSAAQHNAGVRVAVADTGPGIPPDALPRVFDRLYRVDPSRDRATGGSGLGLTIVRRLVEAHGGTVWAESEPGAGSRFGFDLPTDSGQPNSGEQR